MLMVNRQLVVFMNFMGFLGKKKKKIPLDPPQIILYLLELGNMATMSYHNT